MSSTIPVSTTGTAVIATVEPLTTEFVAPTTCYSMQLTQLSSPYYQIWLNEPQPVPGTRYPNCYPSEWMNGYTSVFNATSSIAPMMSPLVAPENWSTVKEMDNGYIALCPSGFQIHLPDDPVDTNRPAYGATCYSNFKSGETVVLSGFDSEEYTGQVTFLPSATDQCYAHVIEGKKASTTASTSSSGTGTITSAPIQTATSTSSSSSSGTSNSISGGAVAGAVIGALAGLVLIILAIFFLFRRRRAQRVAAGEGGPKDYTPEMGAAYHDGSSSNHNNNAYSTITAADKALPDVPASEAAAVSPGSEYPNHSGGSPFLPPGYAELDGNHAAELDSRPDARELDSGYHGSELQSAGQNHGFSQQH